MTHRGLVGAFSQEGSNDCKGQQLAVRVNPSNPAHHLWNNNGTWFMHYTVYPDHLTARRIRRSLKTRSLTTALARRDAVLGERCLNRASKI